MRSVVLLLALLSSISAFAGRVRVVVVVGLPEAAMVRAAKPVTNLRAEVLGSLRGATNVATWGESGAFEVEIDASEVDAIRRDPRVRAVSIDDGGEGAMLESLPLIGMDLVRAQGLDGAGVTVAVLDTGIDRRHPDFAGRVIAEQCFCDNGDGTGCCPGKETMRSGVGAAEDDHGHGTHVTGIIAGGGAVAPMGIAPKAKIISVKVMDSTNSFRSFTQVYLGLDWILTEHPEVDVINMSLGSFALYSAATCENAAVALGMENVIAKLRERGVLITASSGNQASIIGTTLPACMGPVLGIGATYDAPMNYVNGVCSETGALRDGVACFTNSTTAIDLLAPGAMITSSMRNGSFANWSGTSMAAPHVAGAIALMRQQSRTKITADQIESILKTTGKPVTDARNGLTFRRLDIAAAIAATPKVEVKKRRAAQSGK
jgi:subtilisin family serine protease